MHNLSNYLLSFPASLPPATKVGQGYVFTGCVWFCLQGEYLTRYTPLDQVHPPDQVQASRTRYTTPLDQVHPLPPWDQVHPPRYTPPDQVCPQDQVQPPTWHTPRPGTPPILGTSPDQVHPLDQVHPQDQVHPPDQVPPCTRYTSPPHQVHPPGPGRYGLRAGGTHPTGMQSCIFMF